MRIKRTPCAKAFVKYKGHDHQEAIEQLFEIHEIVLNLSKGGKKFDGEYLYRNIVVKTFKSKARVEYVKWGGNNLCDQDNALDLLGNFHEEIELEVQVSNDQKRYRGNDNGKRILTNNT